MAKKETQSTELNDGAGAPETEAAAPATEHAKKAPFAFRVKAHVTLPLRQFHDNETLYIRSEAAIVKAAELKKARATPGGAVKQPPELMHVVDLETGEHCQIIVNAVLADIFRDNFPDNSYVGKSFMVVRHAMKEGKNYATFTVTEIEVD